MIKKIVIVLLILSITIPSYASVSVSDGSSFVSKSEFTVDLNNLSNRISRLENSIDSKIDSLVSAYLATNGIWNGEKQTLVTDNASWEYGFGSDTTSRVRIRINLAWNTSMGTDYNYNRSVYYYNSSNGIYRVALKNTGKSGNLVNSITKTGLAIVKTSCTDASTTDGRCYIVDSHSGVNRLHEDNFLFIYSAKISFKQDGNTINSVETQQIEQYANLYLSIKQIPAVVLIMFVEKNKPLTITYENTLQNQYAGTTNPVACTLGWVSGGQESSTRTWKVEDVTVY